LQERKKYCPGKPGYSTYLLTAMLRENTEKELSPIYINNENIDELTSGSKPINIPDHGRRLLRRISQKTDHFGQEVRIEGRNDYPLAYCRNDDELHFIIEYLESQGWIEKEMVAGLIYEIVITPSGWSYLEDDNSEDETNPRVFVAMSFDPGLESEYASAIAPAIEGAGFKPVRIDKEHFLGKIDDEIISEIRRSRFMVSDFTHHKAGVYFETGFAMGLRKPIIWLCKKNDIDKTHFDTRQYPHVLWETAEELKDK
jgi:hypothetical protein